MRSCDSCSTIRTETRDKLQPERSRLRASHPLLRAQRVEHSSGCHDLKLEPPPKNITDNPTKETLQFVMGPPPLPVEARVLLVSITLYWNSSFFLMMTLRNPFAGRRRSIPSTSGSVPGLKSLMRYSNGSLFWKTILPAFGVTSTLPGGSGVCSIMVIVLNRGNTVSF